MCDETRFWLFNVVLYCSYWLITNLFLSFQILGVICFSLADINSFLSNYRFIVSVVLLQELTIFFLKITASPWVWYDEFLIQGYFYFCCWQAFPLQVTSETDYIDNMSYLTVFANNGAIWSKDNRSIIKLPTTSFGYRSTN